MAQGGRKPSVPDGGKTMQIDALVDDLEEIAAAPDLAQGNMRPPPLPPKKASRGMVIAGVLIVLVMAALGIGAGAFLMGEPETAPAEAAAEPPAPAADATEGDPDGADDEGGDIVQIDEVVVGAE